jgi:hypothetical protein
VESPRNRFNVLILYVYAKSVSEAFKFCGKRYPPYSAVSTKNSLVVKMVTGNHTRENHRIGFMLYYTVYRTGEN